MTENKITIGLAGVANHGTTILNAILASPNLRLVSCYDLNTGVMNRVAEEQNIKSAKSFEDLINDSDLDAVALVTPNHVHREQVEKAARMRKHVFLEKPISNTITDAREIVRVMREANRVLSIGHNARRKRTFRRARIMLEENRIGTVVGIEANLSRPAGLQQGLPDWKADPQKCPLLPMMQLGIHFVDTIRYLLGPIEAVSCIAGRIAMTGDVYDSSAALLRMESGIPAALSSYYVSPDAYFIKLYGTKGIMHCTSTALRIETTEDHTQYKIEEEDFSDEGMESYILEMTEFADCILNGTEPETGGNAGLEALAVIEAMVQSIETGRTVKVSDIIR
jgi:predicted dehydrogenase